MLKKFIQKLKRQKKNAVNIGFYFMGSLISMMITLAINPFIALNMSNKDYALTGYFASFNSLFTPLISFFFISYYSRRYFLMDENQRERTMNTMLISLLWFSCLISLLSLLGLYIFFRVTHVSFSFFPYALLSISAVFFINFYSFHLVDLRLKKKAKEYFKLSVSRAVISALLAVLLVVVIKGGALGKMAALTISNFIFGLIDFKRLFTKWEFDKKIFKDALKFCWPLVLAGALSYFFTGIDRVFLEKKGDMHQLGLFNVAIQIAGYLTIFNTTIANTFQPDILKSIAERKTKRTLKLFGGITLMNSIPVILFIIFAPFVIKVLTYNRFTDAAGYARIFAISNISSSLYFSLSIVIVGYGFSKITLANRVIGTILSFLMFKVMIENFGFTGAAWGHVFAYLIMFSLSLLFLYYKLKISKNKNLKNKKL